MDEFRVGNRIRAFRKLKGYTQLELARQLGISVSVLGSVERGMKQPQEKMVRKIADILQISFSEFGLKDNE